MLGETVNSFQTFGAAHLAALAVAGGVAAGLTLWAKKASSPKVAPGICWAIAGVLLGNEFVYYGHGLATRPLLDFARNCLPVHICGVATYLTAWALIRGRDGLAFEAAYFWGLAGTAQALLMPNLLVDFPDYRYFQFFIAHGGIVVGVLFALFALGMRPRRGGVLRIFLISNAYVLFAAAVNWLLGANYMFLCEPPAGVAPYFFLPWPWYIIFVEFVGLGLVILLALPFALARRS